MTMYDVIHEELQDRVDCGMLTLEDAEILDDVAYERYVDDCEDDDITLEDAMDYIDDVLTEAESSIFDKHKMKKYESLKNDKLAKINNANTVKESVDEMRLRVYEAHDEGLISESDRDLYLDYLDLENYE